MEYELRTFSRHSFPPPRFDPTFWRLRHRFSFHIVKSIIDTTDALSETVAYARTHPTSNRSIESRNRIVFDGRLCDSPIAFPFKDCLVIVIAPPPHHPYDKRANLTRAQVRSTKAFHFFMATRRPRLLYMGWTSCYALRWTYVWSVRRQRVCSEKEWRSTDVVIIETRNVPRGRFRRHRTTRPSGEETFFRFRWWIERKKWKTFNTSVRKHLMKLCPRRRLMWCVHKPFPPVVLRSSRRRDQHLGPN